MCTDDNGNIYTLAEVNDKNIKADTFFQSSINATGNQFKILLMSHDCEGNMRFAKLLQSSQNNRCHGLAYHNGI